jgi:hypothetical protein
LPVVSLKSFLLNEVQQAASLLMPQIFVRSGCQQAGSLLYIQNFASDVERRKFTPNRAPCSNG